VALAAYRTLRNMGLDEDWRQEIRCAAWQAWRCRLLKPDAMRHFGRAANQALRLMGFGRGRGQPGYTLRRYG
jgi:hypothetical protein